MANENRSLMNTIRQRQKRWLRGHVLRSESLLRTVLEGRMEGTRTRGRQTATIFIPHLYLSPPQGETPSEFREGV